MSGWIDEEMLTKRMTILCVELYKRGLKDGGMAERARAVEAGVGRYVSDPATGERRFVYGVENEK